MISTFIFGNIVIKPNKLMVSYVISPYSNFPPNSEIPWYNYNA